MESKIQKKDELNTPKEKPAKKETKQSKFLLSFFLILVLAIELAIGYFGYELYYESINQGINIATAIVSIMVAIFIYFLTLFSDGKLMMLVRNTLVFFLVMSSLAIVVILKIEINNIQTPKGLTVEYINEKFTEYDQKLQILNNQNIELKAHITKQNNEHIRELIINRKAINAQQKYIKGNSNGIESAKKYQIIKNPF